MTILLTLNPLQSINTLIADFKCSPPLYECGHVFFTSTCSDALFKLLGNSIASRYILTLKELNISFLPYESQVFSLDFTFDDSRSESRSKSSSSSGRRKRSTFRRQKPPFTNAMPQQALPLLPPNLGPDQKLVTITIYNHYSDHCICEWVGKKIKP